MAKPNCERLEEILERTELRSLWKHFEEEGIDDGVVDGLTEADLERLGIEKFRRILIMVAIKDTRSSYVGPEMVLVEGGALPVGSEVLEKRVGRFWMGKHAVTWGEWNEVREWGKGKGYEMEEGRGKGERYPVTDVSWYSVVKWCNARSEKEGLVPVYEVGVLGREVYRSGDKVPTVKVGAKGYRLPSEGEWEWAARGGVKGKGYEWSGSDDSEEVGWYCKNSRVRPNEVGTKKPNELGIFDLSGNVCGWCFDQLGSTGTDRVFRGGSCYNYDVLARVSYRSGTDLSSGYIDIGFRVVRSSVP